MKIPTTPVILASLTFATSSLAAPTSKKPDCGSPSIGERSPLLAQDSWEPALKLKGKGVSGQGRPWGARKRDEDPSITSSPSLNTESVPPVDGGAATATGLGLPAAQAQGVLSPVGGIVGSASGTVKGAIGTGTNTLNGLLGGTPLGPVVGNIGNVGSGAAGGLLDSVGGIGSSLGGATGGLGLGNILKPVTGTVGGLLGGLPVVGPIAGGLTNTVGNTVGGLSLAQTQTQSQINPLNVASDPSMIQYPVPGMGAPTPPLPPTQMRTPSTGFMAQAQVVEEKVVGDLGGGSFLTNTGRIVSLLPAGVPAQNPLGSNPMGGLGGLTGQIPSGLTGGLDNLGNLGGGLGQTLQPITSNPLGQGALAGLPLGQNPLDLGSIVSNLPPGLSQIIQPVGSADKFLQIGQKLIPLGAVDHAQLAQLGLGGLPITAVNGIPGVPTINYLQDQGEGGAEGEEESKKIEANPVTTWMNGGSNSTIPEPTTVPMPSSSTAPDAAAPAETSAPGTADPPTSDGSGSTPAPDTPTGLPAMAQMNIQPMYVAPTDGHRAIVPGSSSASKGFTQWSEISLNEGETFDRIADGMAGREKNYYRGSDLPSTSSSASAPALPSATFVPGYGNQGNGTVIDDGPRDRGPDFHANKGRQGWQLIDVEDESQNGPSSTSGQWHRITETGTPSATANVRSTTSAVGPAPAPTLAPQDDSGTYAWNEDWGDWVSAGMDDLNAGWDDSTAYAPSPSSQPAGSSTMSSKHSAGLS